MNASLLSQALAAHRAGNLAAAAGLYRQVLQLHPHHFQALFALAFIAFEGQDFEAAERLAGEAAKVNPSSADAFFVRGCALHRLRRFSEALSCFDRVLAIDPRATKALSNRGATLLALQQHALALAAFDAALAIDPANPTAWNNRGCALKELRRFEEAALSFEKAVALKPTFVDALINSGSVLATLKRYDRAAAAYERALSISPNLPFALGNLILYRLHAADWSHLEEDRRRLHAGLKAGEKVADPFVSLVCSWSAEDQLTAARIFVAHEAPPASAPLWRGETYRHDKIRIAYVSNIFHAHATAALVAGVFQHHDRTRFETTAVSFGIDDGSALRARMAASFDRFTDMRDRDDRAIAAFIRECEIDIAVDLTGYTRDHRSRIFAARPAPLQVNYLGYPGTMGAPYYDYIIADQTLIPKSEEGLYAEKVVHLPDTYQSNDSERAIAPDPRSRAELGLPPDAFVFCSFNNSNKIQPETFGIWMRLLQAVPESVLWLLDDNDAATRNLKHAARERGIAPERLIFAPRIDPEHHLARHRQADLFLDTLPYGAHTTASDALWAGLPVLTRLGPTFAGRVAASLLRAAGIADMIAPTEQAYENLALKLARDKAALRDIRSRLERQRRTSPLFDTARFTRHLERAFVTMWERQRRGEPPAPFAVEPLPPRA